MSFDEPENDDGAMVWGQLADRLPDDLSTLFVLKPQACVHRSVRNGLRLIISADKPGKKSLAPAQGIQGAIDGNATKISADCRVVAEPVQRLVQPYESFLNDIVYLLGWTQHASDRAGNGMLMALDEESEGSPVSALCASDKLLIPRRNRHLRLQVRHERLTPMNRRRGDPTIP